MLEQNRPLASQRRRPPWVVLLVAVLTAGCATWTPEPQADLSSTPPRHVYEKMMFGPDEISRPQRISWMFTIGMITMPFWGVGLSADIIGRGFDTGRWQTRYDDPSTPAYLVDRNFDFGGYRALVIGNQDYRHLDDLNTPRADAHDISVVLRELYGFETTTLQDATRNDIIAALVDLRSEVGPRDNLLVYYSGHGVFDEEVDEAYWLPVEAELEVPSSWISSETISTMLKGIPAKHILVIADSCYSGATMRDVVAPQHQSGYLYELARKPARILISSGGVEPVQDDGGGANSIFARHLLTELRQNELPVLEASTLFARIKQPIMDNASQTPSYMVIREIGHEGGDFLFLRATVPDPMELP